MPDSRNGAPAATELDLTAVAPQGWTRTAGGLTDPRGRLTLSAQTFGNHDMIHIRALGADAAQPLWWIRQWHGARTPTRILKEVLAAAADGPAAPATRRSMERVIGAAGARWPQHEDYPSRGGGANRKWTKPDGDDDWVSASALSRASEDGGWWVNRSIGERWEGRLWQWQASPTTPQAVICALALTYLPTCRTKNTAELREVLSGLELSPSLTSDRLFVKTRPSDTDRPMTIGAIEREPKGWTVRVVLPDGAEQRLPGTSCCIQQAMATAWTDRRV